jgi:hypothetical protein
MSDRRQNLFGCRNQRIDHVIGRGLGARLAGIQNGERVRGKLASIDGVRKPTWIIDFARP